MGFIYKITSPSKKMYVGQTKKKVPQKRWIQHCWPSYTACIALKNAIIKYGAENMTFETIEECSNNLLNDREEHWIRELKTLSPHGYNLRSGGGVGESVSDETKARMTAMKLQKSIDERGYNGTISESNNNTFQIYVYNTHATRNTYAGTYSTREEAQEALREYTRDPENFVPNLFSRKHGTGSVYEERGGRWHANFNEKNKKRKSLGYYDTKEEAQNACDRFLEDPDGFVMPPLLKRRNGTGRVCKAESGRFIAVYKGKHLGTFDTEAQAEAAILARKEKIEGKKPLKE